METGVIVDLSDDVEMENARKKLDRKRFNEIRKYIPFLQYITAKDPVKNDKYVLLLQWFNSNKNLPARVATTCEFAIKKRFKALQSSMVFPPHIISIFEGGVDAIDLVSDDDDEQLITSKNASISTTKQSNQNNLESSSKNIEVTQKENTIVGKQTDFKNVTDTNTKVNEPKPLTSSTQSGQNDSITSVITIEEGEVLSDSENVTDHQKRKKTKSISLSEISLIEPQSNQNKSSVMPEDHDEILNQDLFNRIDDLDGDSVNPIATPELSWEDLEKEDSTQRKGSPILKPKNLESFSRKSPKHLSNSSDEEPLNAVLVQRKKKKKHKHKKKIQIQVIDPYDKSETENHQSEKQRPKDQNQDDSSHKQKKTYKRKKEKLKFLRPLYVSDDEDDQSNLKDNAVVESVKKAEPELFKRRDVSLKETIPTENSSSDSITVVLLDSDEDEINTAPENLVETKNEVKSSPILEPQSSKNETIVSSSYPIIEEKTTNLLDTQKKVESSSPNKLKDLNNMGLNELNDIYAKLCEKTGIQLEELLGDLVNKSAIPAEDNSVTIIQDTLEYSRHTSNFNNNDINEDCHDSYNVQEKQFQQHQLQQQNLNHHQHIHQQNIHYQQQQEQMQFESHQQQQQQQQQHLQQRHHQQQQQQLQQQQQQDFHNHMHCASNQIQNNSQVSYPYQNSLMPRLNLNDPRIVQKLKQIKDSPIHNLSIRESATLLMNCYTERPIHRSVPPVVKVTSNTATTYGEHKRLKEMEKLELERKAKQSKETEKTHSPTVLQENFSEVGALSPKINSTNKKQRKDSSGSENSQKLGKPIQNKTLTPSNSPSYSGDMNQSKTKEKRTISSDYDSGRKTPKSRTDTEEDEETVVMSFIGRPKSRQRIDSSSSCLTNDTVDLECNSTSIDNSESNIRKVVKIVMSHLGQTRENMSPKPSRSRKNSSRKSTDSTKSDAKSPKPINNSGDEERSNNSSIVKSAKGKTQRLRRKTNDQLNKTPEKPKQPQPKRGCRELENLNCTFKEYREIFEKFSLPTKDGKRLCSTSGSSTKKHEFTSSNGINEKSRKTVQNSDDHDCDFGASSSKVIRAAPIDRRRQTCGEPNKSTSPIKVCFRRLSENGKFSAENKHDMECSDETDEFDIEEHRKIKNGLQKTYTNIDKDPFNPILRVTLHRLSTNEIMKWIKFKEVESQSTVSSIPISVAQNTKPTPIKQNTIDISKLNFEENPILIPINSKPVNISKKTTPKGPIHLNNNINMTLNSTKTCVICNKRPLDLTNHYVVQHQTESYTSRLTSEEIDNLEANIPLAVPHRNRYKVTCAFCQVDLEENFVNFHAHFSYHTGEYGFRCAVCDLVKPYREDIKSHQFRTSACLNGKVRANYLYSPDLVVIYLYVCNLCNFVQLNEANIHKHQRDHHGFRFEEPQNVKKVIIAALDNGRILNEIMPADLEEDELTPTIEKDTQNVEQEFLNEHPLDIKDVLLTHQQFPSTSQLALFENLLQDINIDNETLPSVTAPIPEAGMEQLQASPTKAASNIMTVIHTSSDKTCQESHKPYIEPVDEKPELKEIKSGSTPNVQIMQSRMVYRQMPVASNYFGMYKCTLNDCWFSSNEANEFVNHISSVHNSAERKIFLDCAYCKYKSTRASNIVAHVREKHLMCRFQCAECAYRTTIPGNVAIHRKVFHKNSNSVKHIYECGNRVSQLDEKPTDLMQKMVENIASLNCLDCSKSFYAVSSIKSHIQKVHPLTFAKLGPTSFNELACLHCKEESNNKEIMRMHLALDHPDEIGYVVERKLKNKASIDAVENLNMVNISMPISPSEVHTALIKGCDIIPNITNSDAETLIENAPPSKIFKPNPPEITIVEDLSITPPIKNVPTVPITEEEKRLIPLLELLTENTGAPASSLYRCPQCVASFLHYELWRKHIKTRHNIIYTVSCHYCSKQLSLELAAMHFESHRRHEYICFHCVTSFCSREKICEHFASFHPEFRTTIERKIAYMDVLFSIFKEKYSSLAAVNWLPLFQKLSDALRQQLSAKLQQNQHNKWLAGLSASCLTEFEDLETPKYIVNGLPRYKCLVKSCPFVGSDENTLDVHMTEHPAPDKYKCSQCLIHENNPTWEKMKNHKMLHKQEIHICCVCKFFHHSFVGMCKHIEQLHNIRDVPVVSVWRDEMNYKTSLAIVLTERKMSFTTTDTCFCCLKVLKNKLVYHLRKEHKVSLFPKCVKCDAIILTHLDAEAHAKNHQSKPFRLKYEVLTPFLYNAIITSISPLTFETRLIKEKRPSNDVATCTSKKVKPNEEVPIKIKQEVVIKTESQEIDSEIPSATIKCVNLENLMQNQTNCTQPNVISISALTMANSQEIQHRIESVGQCYIPNYPVLPTNSGLILSQNHCISPGITVVSYPQEAQLSTNLRTQNPQLSIIAQPQSTILNQACPLLKELGPVCGNCNFECSDFAQLKMHFSTVHAFKNERFLFRLNRRVGCVYCGFQCNLHSLAAHHQASHPERARLCHSLIDSSRCGMCHEIFSSPLSTNSLQLPACGCPRRVRLLADCLDLNTLRLIQDFGQNFFKYTCDICNMSFNLEQLCRHHIVQVHKKAIYPKLTSVEMMFVCYKCEETNTSVGKVIEHIHKVHLCTLRDASIDMISSIYRKIKIIYPKGLTICAGDLKSTRHCHDVEIFKQTLQDSELK